jgi:hypothetical protein
VLGGPPQSPPLWLRKPPPPRLPACTPPPSLSACKPGVHEGWHTHPARPPAPTACLSPLHPTCTLSACKLGAQEGWRTHPVPSTSPRSPGHMPTLPQHTRAPPQHLLCQHTQCVTTKRVYFISQLLFITCTITVGHMTDASSLSHMTHYESFLGLHVPYDSS